MQPQTSMAYLGLRANSAYTFGNTVKISDIYINYLYLQSRFKSFVMSDIDLVNPKAEIICSNCGNEFEGHYCPACGQKVIHHRNTVKHFFKLLFNSFDIDRGIVYTTRMLFTDPDIIVNDYLNGKTIRYYNPLKYLLVLTSFYAILMIGFNVFDTNVETTNEMMGEYGKQTQFQQSINSYIKRYLSIIPILILPFYSIVSKWMFRKHKLYYGEHLLINTYLYAQYIVMATFLMLSLLAFDGLLKLLLPLGYIILTIYYTYATKKIFNTSYVVAFLKSFVIILLGMVFFVVFVVTSSILVFSILAVLGFDIQQMLK